MSLDPITIPFNLLLPLEAGQSEPEVREITAYRVGDQIISSEGDFSVKIPPESSWAEMSVEVRNRIEFLRAAETLWIVEQARKNRTKAQS